MTQNSEVSCVNKINKATQSTDAALDIQYVASLVQDWRAKKKSFFDPIPTKIKSLVFQLISTQVYSFSTLQKYLSFTHSQLKSIKSQFSDNNDKLIKTQTPTNTQSNPDFLPFKVVPHDSTTFNQASDSNYSNCKQLKNTLNNTNASDYHSINITADDGAQLNLPAHLSSDLILNIIKLFLCSK